MAELTVHASPTVRCGHCGDTLVAKRDIYGRYTASHVCKALGLGPNAIIFDGPFREPTIKLERPCASGSG